MREWLLLSDGVYDVEGASSFNKRNPSAKSDLLRIYLVKGAIFSHDDEKVFAKSRDFGFRQNRFHQIRLLLSLNTEGSGGGEFG